MTPEGGKKRAGRPPRRDVPSSFTRLLRELHARSSLSQKDYAAQLGVEARTVYRWLNGDEPSALAFLDILALAGVDVADILHKLLAIPDALDDAPPPAAYTIDRLRYETRETVELAHRVLEGQGEISQRLARLTADLREHDAAVARRLQTVDLASVEAAVRAALSEPGSGPPSRVRRSR